ncbi:MAG: potassium transporter [Desulfatirhabdiaceae bacterium]
MSDSSIWILGAGYFGKKAVTAARNRFPNSGITVVDQNPDALKTVCEDGVQTVCMEAVLFVHHHLQSAGHPGWIVPVVPIHLAWEWIRRQLQPENRIEPIEIPDAIRNMLPNTMPGKVGEIYTSIASFKCPDNCPEPAIRCTHTGLPRPLIMYDFLESMRYQGVQPVVIRSRQLAPGIGGYSPADLFTALEKIQRDTGSILLCTACKCHGVVQSLIKR